jgi:RNA polymerase sigma factor (TIGR02999 family)
VRRERGREHLDSRAEVTGLLRQWAEGDRRALDRVVDLVYEELRRLASSRLREERPDHTLGATALVHEAYLRLVDIEAAAGSRAHFLALASRAMRRVLVDHARHRNARKRGGGQRPVTLDDALHLAAEDAIRFLDLDEALARLESLDPRQAAILEQHYFGGLSISEIAEATDLSRSTVKRDLRFARAWLAAELDVDSAPDEPDVA